MDSGEVNKIFLHLLKTKQEEEDLDIIQIP